MGSPKEHRYTVHLEWTGNLGDGTREYRGYSRDHVITGPEKRPLDGSADPAFRGDPSRYNPEELLVASLSACHMLWYLHLCSSAHVIVTAYEDDPTGTMIQRPDGGGYFEEVVLRPAVTIRTGCDLEEAIRLHELAHERCYVANSVRFPVRCEPTIREGVESTIRGR